MKKRIEVDTSPGWAATAAAYAVALRAVLTAVGALPFDQKRRVIRWACDAFEIDPTKL